MIYGYKLKELENSGFEMKEVTFSAPPEVLRQIAAFLEQMAQKMEDGFFERCSHVHIGSLVPEWDKNFPNKDIIVMPPEGSPHIDVFVS
ncbi:MAG TPA: hypothetical protein VKS79_18230 [Gemmataceae bacterium]|nr:hypothetical protein [Gemmataceae bacterium]